MSKKAFEEYLLSKFPADARRSRSALIHRGFSDKIVCYLKGGDVWRGKSNEEKHLRHFVRKSGFKLLDLPAVGVRDDLVVAVKLRDKSCEY